MTKQKEPENYQDFVTYQTPPVKVISSRKIIDLFFLPNYYVILIALRKRPMTVRDLEQAFKEEADRHAGIEPKSDKSIYRYLKVLEEAELVVPAGQRVVSGKMVTETLFARTGQIFLLFYLAPEWWLTKSGKNLAKRIGTLMIFLFGGEQPPIKELQKLFMEFEQERQSTLERLATEGDKQVLDILATSPLEEHFLTETYVGYLVTLINNPEFLERLKKLMKVKK
ncbi:MAG: helix-turn-helix domain-containing protein [Candidatus Hermodarchaeota archaeon]|nr:helix-turn-helix domain-containing protein [Candidatus Hermodarchaeota archaeon]